MILAEIVGYIGAVVGTSIMIPQLYKSYKTKRVNDISGVMLGLFLLNCIIWEIYGLLMGAMPIIICNIVAFIIVTIQIIIKIKFHKK